MLRCFTDTNTFYHFIEKWKSDECTGTPVAMTECFILFSVFGVQIFFLDYIGSLTIVEDELKFLFPNVII